MPLSPAATRLQAQLRAAWIHAARSPVDNPLVIPAREKNDAVQLRFKLYNTAKRARLNPDTDPELADAVSRVGLRVEPHAGQWRVVFFHNTAIAGLAAIVDGLGEVAPPPVVAAAEPPSPDFSGVLRRLADEGLMPPPAPPELPPAPADPFITKNPFYTRTGTGRVE